jgi:APA family basic amino acid/polyamine antiporter
MTTAPATRRDRAAATGLARRLGTFDAVVMGLGAMIGAGIFTALAPASAAAGRDLLLGLLLAAAVAYCNATSSAALAALYPESGGTYIYGRKRLSPFFGALAGWGFVVGKVASCAAMALTFANYAAPEHSKALAVSAVVALAIVNYFGIAKTAFATRMIVAFVLACLAVVMFGTLSGGAVVWARAMPALDAGPHAILQAAGFMFFAFAGYARLATLGEEVRDPSRTIPRAIPLTLGITLVVYAVVAVGVLASVDSVVLATSSAPLATALEQGRFASLAPLVRVGAAVASLGVLLSLLAGVSRTTLAMARNDDLPSVLASVHPRYQVPDRAEIAVAVVVAVLVLTSDVRSAIGFSAFTVLVYYAIANACALTLRAHERRWPRFYAAAGLVGCLFVAASLPMRTVIGGIVVLAAAAVVYAFKSMKRGPA